MRRAPKRKKKGGALKAVLIILVVIAATVNAFCIFKLTGIMRDYKTAEDAYKEIEALFLGDTGDFENPDFQWDYDKLLALCADAKGYIYQKGIMSYPIVQGVDNEQYLRALMSGEYSVTGTIFVDYRCEQALDSMYAIVYGHNMDNDTIFGSLSHYEDEEYYNEHPYFDIYAGYKHYRYYVFSAFVTDVESYVYETDQEEEGRKAFYDRLRAECSYETDVRELTAEDHVLTLSTCVDWHDYDYRYIVCLVRGEEIAD